MILESQLMLTLLLGAWKSCTDIAGSIGKKQVLLALLYVIFHCVVFCIYLGSLFHIRTLGIFLCLQMLLEIFFCFGHQSLSFPCRKSSYASKFTEVRPSVRLMEQVLAKMISIWPPNRPISFSLAGNRLFSFSPWMACFLSSSEFLPDRVASLPPDYYKATTHRIRQRICSKFCSKLYCRWRLDKQ